MNAIENINKEIEIIKLGKKWELRSTVTEMKNQLQSFNSIFKPVEERISKFEDIPVKMIQSEEEGKKRRKKN